jgi:hypothetical protein
MQLGERLLRAGMWVGLTRKANRQRKSDAATAEVGKYVGVHTITRAFYSETVRFGATGQTACETFAA